MTRIEALKLAVSALFTDESDSERRGWTESAEQSRQAIEVIKNMVIEEIQRLMR